MFTTRYLGPWIASIAGIAALAGAGLVAGCDGVPPTPDTGTPPTPDSGPPGCAIGQTMCATGCTNTASDSANCGGCGLACAAGESCVGGDCEGACPAGQTSCGGSCVDTTADAANCGGCGTVCAVGEDCVASTCEASSCPTGETECGGACVDTATDTANCGDCGTTCDIGSTCEAGSCVELPCEGTQTRCAGSCVETNIDALHCGACGNACEDTEVCDTGSCVPACAPPGMVCTVDTVPMCIDTDTSLEHCGACDAPCSGGSLCTGGSCSCPTGQTDCSGTCVNTDTDPSNCGDCGMACGAGQGCAVGACTCPSGLTACGALCANTTIDPMNCGSCGTTCGAGQTCSSSSCSSICGAGTTFCSGTCINPQTDNMNCGGCGTVCGTGTRCVTGACRPLNDNRTSAIAMTPGTAEVTVTGTTAGSTHDGPSPCGCTSGGNVWYRFTTPRRGVVYLDTAGSSYDTSLFLTDSAGTTVSSSCSDDAGCSAGGFTSIRQSRVALVLAAGTYYVAVGGCGTGNFTLHLQYMRDDVAGGFIATPLTGSSTTIAQLAGPDMATSSCGGSSGSDHARWFVTCGGQPQTFSLCRSDPGAWYVRRYNAGSSLIYDPVLYLRTGQTGAQVACNDDGLSMAATDCRGYIGYPPTGLDSAQYGSRINAAVAPRGIGSIFVDNRNANMLMFYNLYYQIR